MESTLDDWRHHKIQWRQLKLQLALRSEQNLSVLDIRFGQFPDQTLCCCCCCSVTQSCPTLCGPMDCSMLGSLSFTISQSLLKLTSIESVMPSNRLILC